MRNTIISVAIIFVLLATSIMSYIAMATPIGPWIETTLVLLSMLIFYGIVGERSGRYSTAVGLTTAAGGIGGIVATALAFSFPTIYFIAPDLFAHWLANIPLFCGTISALALAAGSFGLLMAELCEAQLLARSELRFPIGELLYTTIMAPEQINKSLELAAGFVGTQLLLFVNKLSASGIRTVTFITTYSWSLFTIPTINIPLNQIPLCLAVGFVTGHVIALPLLAGLVLKILCIDPAYILYTTVRASQGLYQAEFIFACCSGIVLYGALTSIYSIPKLMRQAHGAAAHMLRHLWQSRTNTTSSARLLHIVRTNTMRGIWYMSIITLNCICLWYFEFSWIVQLYILICSAIWVYQMLIIAGALGIVPLGRFATFMMVPSLVIFKVTAVQAVITAAFVEIAGGVAGNALFGRKMAQLGSIDHTRIVRYQWLGLFVSALVAGGIFWLFISAHGLGTTGLPVTKAASRALLLTFQTFDPLVLLFGALVGYGISLTKINPALALGGMLMPPATSLLLIAGGLLTYLTKKQSEYYYPLCSGISAGNSLWMLIETFMR